MEIRNLHKMQVEQVQDIHTSQRYRFSDNMDKCMARTKAREVNNLYNSAGDS